MRTAMKSMKRLIASVLIAALALAQLPRAVFADDSDIFGVNVQPNVVILLDNSLSMTDSIPENHHVGLDELSRRITDRKSTRLNSSHDQISYAVFCLKKKNK